MIKFIVLSLFSLFFLRALGFNPLSKQASVNLFERPMGPMQAELLLRSYWGRLRGLLEWGFDFLSFNNSRLREKPRPTSGTVPFRLWQTIFRPGSDFHSISRNVYIPVISILFTIACTGCGGISYLLQAGQG